MQEKIFFTNSRNLSLSAILNNGRPLTHLLLFVHGFAGNKDENGLFIQAEEYFSSKGFNTFRFDFEGVGESNGSFRDTTLKKQCGDLESSLKYLISNYGYNKISIIGFSLGATVSIILNNPLISAYCFWSPAIFPAKDMFPRYNTTKILREFKEKGYFDKAGLKVGKQIINDFKHCNLEMYITNLDKPVLLVHGTKDPRIGYNSTVLAHSLFKNSALELIEGANHSFKENPEHRRILFEKTYEWLSKTI